MAKLHAMPTVMQYFFLSSTSEQQARNDHTFFVIFQTLRERLRGIMDSAQNSLRDDVNAQIAKLDELERTLFHAGQKALQDHQLWLSRRAHILTTSTMVDQHNKRKFSAIDS
ncbi:DNA replication complex GINS protein PSF3-like [Penaeus indicus]|uniref:DNA replication complex GINS protein PSF3-like n=1 Tax=Penaeus indicus TaxID=29960 RepID=UPI00300C6126